jgi:hypothetical protein
MAKPGRKPRAGEAGKPFVIRLTRLEIRTIKRAARVDRKRPADYARDVLLSESNDLLEELQPRQ